jgi:hypothetical protein
LLNLFTYSVSYIFVQLYFLYSLKKNMPPMNEIPGSATTWSYYFLVRNLVRTGHVTGPIFGLPIFSLHGASERECNGIEVEAAVFTSRTSLGQDM